MTRARQYHLSIENIFSGRAIKVLGPFSSRKDAELAREVARSEYYSSMTYLSLIIDESITGRSRPNV